MSVDVALGVTSAIEGVEVPDEVAVVLELEAREAHGFTLPTSRFRCG